MSFFDAIGIAASGLTAERVRMDVTSENLANADTTQGANGQPYRRQEVALQQVGGFGAALSGAMGGPSPAGLLEHDLLAPVRLAAGPVRRLGVGQVLRGDVHPDALGGEAAGGDVDGGEEAHQP